MQKELVLIGALLMIGALFPSAVAHWGDSGGFGDDAKPVPGVVTDGVAGRVVGVAGSAVVDAGNNVATGASVLSCDLEVAAGPGDQAVASDEREVDESRNSVGQVPDNTFDDGGYGGACHLASYANEDFNTEGCGDTADHGQARASPAGVLPVFLGAACDYGTTVSQPDPTGAISAAVCLVNDVLEGDLPTYVVCLDPLTDETLQNCQPDGVPDDVNYGYASTFTGPPVPDTNGCSTGVTSITVHQPVDLYGGDVSQPAEAVWTT